MDLKRLFADDDAVSPVIGVILMVAITVILAAVIAALVLGLGDEPQQTPSAQFEFDYDDTESNLTISHNGGDTLTASEIELRGSGDASATGNEIGGWASSTTTWDSYTHHSSDDVSTGDEVVLAVSDDYEVTVTYVPPGGGDTAPLASDEGPQA